MEVITVSEWLRTWVLRSLGGGGLFSWCTCMHMTYYFVHVIALDVKVEQIGAQLSHMKLHTLWRWLLVLIEGHAKVNIFLGRMGVQKHGKCLMVSF